MVMAVSKRREVRRGSDIELPDNSGREEDISKEEISKVSRGGRARLWRVSMRRERGGRGEGESEQCGFCL
jgi:hypothetical protein